MNAKIATCCYCGTRAVLSLRGKVRHELACSQCGAPLREMKMLRSDAVGTREPERRSPLREDFGRSDRRKKTKKTRSLSQRLMEEVWDVAEDLLDDIFD